MPVPVLDASYTLLVNITSLRAMKSGFWSPHCACAAGAGWRAEPANLDLPTLTDTPTPPPLVYHVPTLCLIC